MTVKSALTGVQTTHYRSPNYRPWRDLQPLFVIGAGKVRALIFLLKRGETRRCRDHDNSHHGAVAGLGNRILLHAKGHICASGYGPG